MPPKLRARVCCMDGCSTLCLVLLSTTIPLASFRVLLLLCFYLIPFWKMFHFDWPMFIMACIVNFYKHQGHFYTNNDTYYNFKKINDIISFWYLLEYMVYILCSNLISPKLIRTIMHFEFKSYKFS